MRVWWSYWKTMLPCSGKRITARAPPPCKHEPKPYVPIMPSKVRRNKVAFAILPGLPKSSFPKPSPQGTPAALLSPILRRMSSPSDSRAAPGAGALRRGGGAALGAWEEPLASYGRWRVALWGLAGVLPVLAQNAV